MANMSYCRFENTANDLRDCVRALEEGDLPTSGYEKDAADQIYKLAAQYIREYENVKDEMNAINLFWLSLPKSNKVTIMVS